MRRELPRAGDKALIVGAPGWPQYNGTISRCLTDPHHAKFQCLLTGIVRPETCCRCELHDGHVAWIPTMNLIRIPPDDEALLTFGRERATPRREKAAS